MLLAYITYTLPTLRREEQLIAPSALTVQSAPIIQNNAPPVLPVKKATPLEQSVSIARLGLTTHCQEACACLADMVLRLMPTEQDASSTVLTLLTASRCMT
jgi:hypothetical protein